MVILSIYHVQYFQGTFHFFSATVYTSRGIQGETNRTGYKYNILSQKHRKPSKRQNNPTLQVSEEKLSCWSLQLQAQLQDSREVLVFVSVTVQSFLIKLHRFLLIAFSFGHQAQQAVRLAVVLVR